MATGKINRLPREIREQVNQRLDAGEPGKRLVAWLNELPAVQALLAAEFEGAAVNEQNLTNWKQGGFREWRRQQEVAAFGVINAEGEETFNAQHSTPNGQGDGKFVEQQEEAEQPIRPTGGQLAVTVEELVTVVAVRYLATVREWQQSPVPVERRWRQMRVILQDVLKLQRGEHREQRLELEQERLELDWERLQFAEEQAEAKQQSDVRRVMVAFLAAARQWPEVGEALATAFRLLQQRKAETKEKEAELEPIKVNQGEKFFENEVEKKGLVNCSPSPVSAPPGRGDDLARFWVQESGATSTTGGSRTEGNGAELGRIKVNQGEIFFEKVEDQDLMEDRGGCPRPGRGPSRTGRARRSGLAGRRPALPVMGGTWTQGNQSESEPIKVNQGEIFFPGRGRTRTRTSNGRGEFAGCCAGGELPDEDWHSRVRKRCRRSALPPQSMTRVGRTRLPVRFSGTSMATPQSAWFVPDEPVCRSTTDATSYGLCSPKLLRRRKRTNHFPMTIGMFQSRTCGRSKSAMVPATTFELANALGRPVAFHPRGWKPGSTAGRMPAATTAGRQPFYRLSPRIGIISQQLRFPPPDFSRYTHDNALVVVH
ncbi:MAG: hypothetical protein P4N60_22305 [Verrucomicrobiae bacterium]|nr:hypothetical protein [Verrucomicrobiae bacterium]